MPLFHHNPPEADLLHPLFINREWEIARLRDSVSSWSASTVNIVHGESRVGKSHLALRFLYAEEVLGPYNLFVVKAASGRTARQILKDLYNQTRDFLLRRGDASAELTGRIRIYDQVSGDRASYEVVYPHSLQESASFQPLVAILGISAEPQTADQHHRVTLPAADEYRLGAILADMCDVIHATTRKRCLFYVDDVDLLDSGPAGDQTEVTVLVRRLESLADKKSIVVLASMRTRHLGSFHKELVELIRVEALEDDDVRSVYKKHVEVFNGGKDVFTDACVGELILATTGHVGNFLRWCSRFHAWGARRLWKTKQNRLLHSEDLQDYALDLVRDLSRREDLARYIDRIRAAIQARKLTVELPPEAASSDLVHFLIEEPAEARSSFFTINPFFARVLRAAVAQEGA